MKNVILVNRIDGMTINAYRDHYENVHAPLGVAHFHFHKYVRNHVVDRDPAWAEFDCLGEFWPAHSAEETAKVLEGPVAQLMVEDRAKFMNTRRTGGQVEEILLAGAPRGFDPHRRRREIVLLTRNPATSVEAYDTALRDLAEQLVADKKAIRVILDRPVPGGPGLGNIQSDGILQVWPAGGEPVIRNLSHPAFEAWAWVATEAYETPPEVCHAAFGGQAPE